MEIKSLNKEISSKIRGSGHINNLSQCVTELVLNSLDAKSSAVAIRLNSMSFRIQVVDNGIGISKDDLERIAHKYSTSKCRTLEDLEKTPRLYGYKGESLRCISHVSKTMVITSKYTASKDTFAKSICSGKHGNVSSVKKRESDGTTVTVDGLFYNLPVRQKRMKKEFEFDITISFLKSMSIIHPNISITLRDDITGKLLFKRHKSQNILKSFTELYPEIKYDDTVVMKVHKDKITVEALLSKDIFQSKTIQHIFVNKRPVVQAKLHALICKKLSQANKKNNQSINCSYPVFVLNIKCPLSAYVIVYDNSDARVEFTNYDLIYGCIEKLILNFLGKPEPKTDEKDFCRKRKSVCGVSDLVGAVKGFGFKEWQDNDEHNTEKFLDIEQSTLNPEMHETPKSMSAPKRKKFKALPIEIHEKNSKNKDKVIVNEEEKKSERNVQRISSFKGNFSDPTCDKNERSILKNFRRLELNCQHILAKHKLEDTLFSNFSSTEEKGKEFLLYMFLKSTEMFRGDTSIHSTEALGKNPYENMNNSIETVLESNIFFKNVTRTKNHQLNENISVSVKLKRKKTFRDPSLFSEKYSFAVPETKKTKYRDRNAIKLQSSDSHNMKSPYFKFKKNNHNRKFEIHMENKALDILKGCNTPKREIFSDQYNKRNSDIADSLYFTRDCNSYNEKFIHKFPMCNMPFQEDSYPHNKSYLFNFDNIDNASYRLIESSFFPQLKNTVNNSGKNFWNNNLRSNNFDFEDLALSPIPKFYNAISECAQEEKIKKISELECQTRSPSIGKNVTTWGRNASENTFFWSRNRYFPCEEKIENNINLSLEKINITHCRKENNLYKTEFKKFHTEPLDHSRKQYILRTKQTIDDFFSCQRLKNYYKKRRKKIFRNNTESFTKDSLEQDENINRSPLWKKFLKKKIEKTVSKNQFSNKIKISDQVSGRKPFSENEKIIESPDLFPELNINSINNFKEYGDHIKDLTFLPNSAVSIGNDINLSDKNEDQIDKLETLTAVNTAKSSDLIITVDNEKTQINDIADFGNKKIISSNGIVLQDEWMRKVNEMGDAFYYNERTGMTTFLHPKQEEIFELKERPQYMPKGLSPVLIIDRKLDQSLSPTSRTKLQGEILKSYADDLGLVKWEKCFNGHNPNHFFENLYKGRANDYEKEVPNMVITKIPKHFIQDQNDKSFSSMVIEDLRVLGQIEQKFIAVIDKKKSLLVLFDQHAAHERVRLEDLLKEYDGKSIPCNKITIFMNETDVGLLKKHEKYLNSLGIQFCFFKNGIIVNGVPICISNKISKESPLTKLIQHLIREILNIIKETRGVLTGIPKIMNQIINMEACKGAIKFGEHLTQAEMETLIEKLSQCVTPFQCAHGRPTLIPLLTLENKVTPESEKLDLKRIVLYSR